MEFKKGEKQILWTNLIAIILFTIIYFIQKNYEFIIYVGVIVFFFALIFRNLRVIKYPNFVIWLLSVWAWLHMAGGALYFAGTRLYDIVLLNIVGAPYYILRYDQAIHAYGFFTATFAMYYLIKPLLKKHDRWYSLGIVIVMAGLGAGALNEILEFFATVVAPSTGVGGYINTSLDLVFNLIGAIIAMVSIRWMKKNTKE